ncbi:MAG: formylglycine-generating enzyme family protein [Cyanobacteria bacterium P01_A01_bin.37]
MPDVIIQRQKRKTQYFTEELESDVSIDMILIRGGIFLMGSPENEPDRRENEGPQHSVTVPTFCMGRYPITQAQWRYVAGMTQVDRDLESDPYNFKGDNRPVEKVSWYDAVEFCARLSRETRRSYRLPTEAEWEYACRAGTTTPYHFGETITTDLANYDQKHEGTTPVDQFGIANAFGLCDMHGNVWEWCQDHWHSSYEGAPTYGSAWLTENEEARHVLRGGSWINVSRYCRSASRYYYNPDSRFDSIGIRVVCGVS